MGSPFVRERTRKWEKNWEAAHYPWPRLKETVSCHTKVWQSSASSPFDSHHLYSVLTKRPHHWPKCSVCRRNYKPPMLQTSHSVRNLVIVCIHVQIIVIWTTDSKRLFRRVAAIGYRLLSGHCLQDNWDCSIEFLPSIAKIRFVTSEDWFIASYHVGEEGVSAWEEANSDPSRAVPDEWQRIPKTMRRSYSSHSLPQASKPGITIPQLLLANAKTG